LVIENFFLSALGLPTAKNYPPMFSVASKGPLEAAIKSGELTIIEFTIWKQL